MLDIVGLLQTEKDAFTRSERALTEIVLADVDSVLKMSIVDLAAQADVSPPTVTRFCRRLGCDSYADFKVRLAQSRFVGQRYFAIRFAVACRLRFRRADLRMQTRRDQTVLRASSDFADGQQFHRRR